MTLNLIGISLKTQSLFNFFKMLFVLLIIVASSFVYGMVDWLGLEIVVYIVLVVGIGWTYRIEFTGQSENSVAKVLLQIKLNLFGNCKLIVKSQLGDFEANVNIKKLKNVYKFETHECYIELANLKQSPMSIDLKISNK